MDHVEGKHEIIGGFRDVDMAKDVELAG